MRFVRSILGSTVGIALSAISLLMTPAYLYFLYVAARSEHVLAFVVGLVLPPVGAVSGVLVWFGAIWHVESAYATDAGKLAMEQRMGSATIPYVADRCGWREFSPDDLEATSKLAKMSDQVLRQRYHFDDSDFAPAERSTKQSASRIDCDNRKVREGMAFWAKHSRP